MAVIIPEADRIRVCPNTSCIYVGELVCEGDSDFAEFSLWLKLDDEARSALRCALDLVDQKTPTSPVL